MDTFPLSFVSSWNTNKIVVFVRLLGKKNEDVYGLTPPEKP